MDNQTERDYLAKGYQLNIEKERYVEAEMVPPEAPTWSGMNPGMKPAPTPGIGSEMSGRA